MMSLNLACSGPFSHILPQIFAKLYGQKFSFLALVLEITQNYDYPNEPVFFILCVGEDIIPPRFIQ